MVFEIVLLRGHRPMMMMKAATTSCTRQCRTTQTAPEGIRAVRQSCTTTLCLTHRATGSLSGATACSSCATASPRSSPPSLRRSALGSEATTSPLECRVSSLLYAPSEPPPLSLVIHLCCTPPLIHAPLCAFCYPPLLYAPPLSHAPSAPCAILPIFSVL